MANITGNNSNNNLVGTSRNDTILGVGGNDTLIGLAGSDLLNGGTGRDRMFGGTGNDRYVVDNVEDVVTELRNQGTDTVLSSINFTLGANLENLTLTGNALFGFGNNLNNVIRGNNLNNWLRGSSGNDSLFGNAGNDNLRGEFGNDFLFGGTGNDLLNGGTGNDNLSGGPGDDNFIAGSGNDTLFGGTGNDNLNAGTGNDLMFGGTGNDIYVVDSVRDVVNEFRNQGTDTVFSSINFTLGANLENLTLTNSAIGQGNNLNNIIRGGISNNFLRGFSGNDSLFGSGGNDTLVGDSGNDSLFGDSGNDTLVGDSGNDSLFGGVGSDTLNGTNSVLNGTGEIDILNPGNDSARDLIILGDSTSVYYNGNGGDFAVIDNFDRSFFGGNNSDKIQISGSLSNYSLNSFTGIIAGVNIVNGTRISLGADDIAYVDSNGLLTANDFV
ncbi:hypothetical protein BJP34_08920 [Moorena producens PAL-8-15-08-1]|uniref:Calcium-binding protein n=1 Tax=Moorena producens PAL-8-15-08-1 TaxID=1458985 RepID=A0A1D8TPG8_9CYAN|nr:calcium-binding protein [Moorena producens]AOW99558.1 hypothetical protein BJP34_08920 [Moorena producens PAL-8-15-08-1]